MTSRNNLRCVAALGTAVLMGTLGVSSGAVLTNRYSFSEDSGTTAVDSKGGKNGTLMNNALFSGGYVYLNSYGVASSETTGDYIVLPPNLVTGLTAVTVETWYVPTHFTTGMGLWARVFDFFNPNAHFFVRSGDDNDGVRGDITTASSSQALDGPPVPNGTESHVVWTSDPATGVAKIYINGVQVATATGFTNTPASVGETPNCWLGRSKYAADMYLAAGYNEFRIYDGTLNPLEIAASYQAGPDQATTDYGNVTGVSVVAASSMLIGNSQQAAVTVSASGITNTAVDVAGQPGLTYASSSPTVITVSPTGVITAKAVGNATVTATYVVGGKTNTGSKLIAVISAPPTLRHRYSFDGTDSSAVDSIGGANGTLGITAVQADGQVALDGLPDSYVSLPANMINSTTITKDAITFESWASFGTNVGWENLFAFGNTVGTAGGNYAFFTPHSGASDHRLIVSSTQPGYSNSGEQGAFAVGTLDGRTNIHVVCIVNFGRDLASIYVNGALAGFNSSFGRELSAIINNFSYLGKSLYDDPYLKGSIDEFRVYDGALSAQQIVAGFNSGPNSTNNAPGNFVNMTMAMPASVRLGWPVSGSVLGNWQNATNVNLAGDLDLVLTSSDPSVLTINAAGLLTGIKTGTATITASYQGNIGTQVVTVTDPSTAVLAHRYSFSEAAGDVVTDSVGGANGHIGIGVNTLGVTNALWTGNGQLVVNTNTTLGAQDTYVDLPDGIISKLTSNATFELWFTPLSGDYWARVFDFGSLPGGDAASGMIAEPGIFFARAPRFDWVVGGGTAGNLAAGGLTTGSKTHLVVLFNDDENRARYYINGVEAGATAIGAIGLNLKMINDTNVWLGRSLYSDPITPTWRDPYFQVAWDEVRIYSGMMSVAEIQQNYTVGPNPPTVQPTLTAVMSGGSLKLMWPATFTGYTAYQAGALGAGASWSPVGGTPAVVGGNFELSVTIGSGPQFFRLQK